MAGFVEPLPTGQSWSYRNSTREGKKPGFTGSLDLQGLVSQEFSGSLRDFFAGWMAGIRESVCFHSLF